jgi:glycine/D-amino acid oxidase-like deaminating enzyme
MSREHDLVVVGGGIAGTMAVLAAASRGVDAVWIADRIGLEDQSAHWHGHLHRGRLYDPVREADLIDELSRNVAFWWSDAAVRFHADVETIAVGPDEEWAAEFQRDRLGRPARSTPSPDYIRTDVASVRTDEAILEGPAFLGAATDAAAARTHRIDGRCTSLTQRAGRWEARWRADDGAAGLVRAKTVILATGTDVPALVPPAVRLDRVVDARLSRMLVLRGELPKAAAIVPSRSAGGLFFASREIPGARTEGERVWLVSDGFSSPGTASRGALTDGWWACSVLERLSEFVREEVLAGTRVGGYRAAKSRLESSPTEVPAEGFALDTDRSFVSLTPSKWSTSPTAAVQAVAALLPDPVPLPARIAAMVELLAGVTATEANPFRETWQGLDAWVPFTDLRTAGAAALRAASSVFEPPLRTVGTRPAFVPDRVAVA